MKSYEQNLKEELEYLEGTLGFLRGEIEKGEEIISGQRSRLVEDRREMWENTAHHSTDFERMTEVNQALIDVSNKLGGHLKTRGIIDKYKRAVLSPYFGRFDFREEGFSEIEKIYLGLYGIMKPESCEALVYDWRSPVAGMYYQYETGRAKYISPQGDINGEVSLKRQYKVENSELKYFLDSSITIKDEMLQEILSHNASESMKSIVETIQKEQDVIIRDVNNELLMVQGAAGSGKTSIALHRIAFLLYHGANSKLGSNNIIIISPNNIFSKYISNVLPELGEENVREITFDEIAEEYFEGRFKFQTRSEQLEELIKSQKNAEVRKGAIKFKGSLDYVKLLHRLVSCYERKMIPIEDIYYDGRIIETRQQLRNLLLNNKIGTPLARRLRKIENQIIEKVHPLRRARVGRIESIVKLEKEHEFEVKPYSRFLSIKEAGIFTERLRRFTRVDYYELYRSLFRDKSLFYKLSGGLELPEAIESIIEETRINLEKGELSFEDVSPLLYLKLLIEGSDSFSEIRQVVVDEAQDYYEIQYQIFKMLFRNAGYTVLGDINQTLERNGELSLYDRVDEILQGRRRAKLFLNKSYRSSYEIAEFNKGLLREEVDFTAFERHESRPQVLGFNAIEEMQRAVAEDIESLWHQGYESIAVICKTREEAEEAFEGLKEHVGIRLVNSFEYARKGAVLIPSYMAKGLEFDAVLIYNTSEENYRTDLDRRLLYVSCTRALHRLNLYYTGEKSSML